MNSPKRIVIVGGGYAGVLAAQRLGRSAHRPEVVLVTPRPELVHRVRLHQRLVGERLARYPIAPWLRGSSARLVVGSSTALDVEARTITVRTEAGDETLAFDRLVLATGSETDTCGVPGVREHALTLDDPERIDAVAAELPSLAARGGSVLVVGGGATGVETASELAERYPSLRVTLVARDGVLGALSPRAAEYARESLAGLGVTVHTDRSVRALERSVAHLEGGRSITFDLCVWTAGFRARDLGRRAGLPVDSIDRVRITESLRVESAPWIMAAGDAAVIDAWVGAPLAMSCKCAMPMAAHAAENLLAEIEGRGDAPFRFGDTGLCVSLGRSDGVIQLRSADGTNLARVITRGAGAAVKEAVARFVTGSITVEARGLWKYRWRSAPRAEMARVELPMT